MFVSPVRRLSKVFLCRVDGRDLQRMSKVTGNQIEPFFSKARQRFFFVRYDDYRRQQIVSVDMLGENLEIHTEGIAQARYPNVSGDGQRLIYSTDRWGAFELAEIDLASGKSTRVTYDQSINTYPRYSPDGRSVAYLSRRHGQSEIYVREMATGAERRLTNTPFGEGPANWRPDGGRLVATRVTPPRFESHLIEIDLKSGLDRILLPETRGAQYPAYSTDGSRIIYVRDQAAFTYDPSDTAQVPFVIRGQLQPEYVQWTEFPLP